MYFKCELELEITTTLVMTIGMVTWTVTYYLMNSAPEGFLSLQILLSYFWNPRLSLLL